MIKLENVSKYYHNEGIVSLGLRKINLELNIGEFVAITGESGSGKSTLLNVISGIDTYEEGELYLNGQETSHFDDDDWEDYRKCDVAFIFQNYNLIDSYSVLKNVEVALVIQGVDKKTRQARAKEIIARVGLSSHLRHRASKLSGGQKQRLAIARALAKDTRIIVADEPTGNLDSESGQQILALLNEVAKEKLVLIVTHNYEQAAPYVSRKIRLFDGEIIEDKVLKNTEHLPLEPHKPTDMSTAKKIATISWFNFLGQPRKSILLLLVSLATVFFVFVFYGRILNTRNESSYFYDFLNSYPERIIMKRKDNQPLTENDYQKIIENKKVNNIIIEDLAVDLRFSMNQFTINGEWYDNSGFLAFNQSFNAEDIIGRLPEGEDEILISLYVRERDIKAVNNLLDKEYTFSLSMYNQMRIEQNYKLVGVHLAKDYDTRFVISDSGLTKTYQNLKINSQKYDLKLQLESELETFYYDSIIIDSSLSGHQIRFLHFDDYLQNKEGYKISFNNQEVQLVKSIDFNYNILYISEEFYETLKVSEDYQYTINLKNAHDADVVIDFLYNQGYYAFSPYAARNIGFDAIGQTIMNLFTIAGMFMAILVVYMIAYLIIKTIFASKVHDYTILRIIGIEKNNVKQIIRFEIITSFMIAFLLFFVIYPFIKNEIPFMEFYKLKDYFYIFIIVFALGFLISRRFIKLQTKKSLFSNLKVE